jgi:alkanesulfonate monooxygenase SsuD/methylene tetrahydromethanopterin reductase-like flavin-dependent oxidoreductase (luciferase family)
VPGIGAGRNVAEYTAYGYLFPDATERLQPLDETIGVVKAMLTQDDANFHGRFFDVDGA